MVCETNFLGFWEISLRVNRFFIVLLLWLKVHQGIFFLKLHLSMLKMKVKLMLMKILV
ncbi:hypothetical protein HanPSC8_Chr05g0223851 [Helianthus annuus]|nr:hypothetical protein HanPSC8_Chr05g0223851 [Helianthus annuus]